MGGGFRTFQVQVGRTGANPSKAEWGGWCGNQSGRCVFATARLIFNKDFSHLSILHLTRQSFSRAARRGAQEIEIRLLSDLAIKAGHWRIYREDNFATSPLGIGAAATKAPTR